MPEDKRVYWDACNFLYYFNKDPRRLPVLDTLLYQAGTTNEIEIFTSTISIVEVAYAATEQGTRVLDPALEQALDDFWNDRSVVKLVGFHQLIARDARSLIRAALIKRWKLTPNDAIHLATARSLNIPEIQTYDTKLHKFGPDIGCLIREPFTAQPPLFPSP